MEGMHFNLHFYMRFIFYIFLISQLLSFLGVFAEKTKENLSELNSVKWEKVDEDESQPPKKIIWKSYKNDESYFENEDDQDSLPNKVNSNSEERIDESSQKSVKEEVEYKSNTAINNLINHGGITVSNALIPRAGTSQIFLNYDNKGNIFGFYGYSLSNIFHLELLNIGSFNEFNLSGENNSSLNTKFLSENNLNFRIGGKLLISSSKKENLYWLSLRSSFGRNNDNNRDYLFSELINTLRVNDWITFNINTNYL